jgi:hypothetical protein
MNLKEWGCYEQAGAFEILLSSAPVDAAVAEIPRFRFDN